MSDNEPETQVNEPQGSGRSERPVASDEAGVQALEASRTQRAFLANLRHELRTPLNAIIGYGEMLQEDAADGGQEGFIPDLQKIHTAGNQLLELVNDVLDPTKIEPGELTLDLESLGANLRHELRTPVSAIIGYCEILLEDAEDRDQDGLIPDLNKIHSAAQHFLSLINDIVNFFKINAGELYLNQQASETSAMVQGVVATIPALVEDYVDTAPAERGSLLIVDDNKINGDLLARRLERQGHTVTVVDNGRQALEVITTQKFDLVLLDVMMPEMNGYQVLQRLKADATLHDLPVIMLSALDEIDSVVWCIEMGAEDYLPKPFNPVLLRARIGACLEKKRLRDQEVEYLRNVAHITAAAAAVDAGEFDLKGLPEVAARPDELGQLARVFQQMAREVYAREQRLRQQVQELRIGIDETKKARQVAEITETEYFQELRRKSQELRNRAARPA